jgi:hypothetical protein
MQGGWTYECKYLFSVIRKNRHNKKIKVDENPPFLFYYDKFYVSKPLKKRAFLCNKKCS